MSKAAAVMVGRTRSWVSKAAAVIVASPDRPSATLFSEILFLLSPILWLLRYLTGGGGEP